MLEITIFFSNRSPRRFEGSTLIRPLYIPIPENSNPIHYICMILTGDDRVFRLQNILPLSLFVLIPYSKNLSHLLKIYSMCYSRVNILTIFENFIVSIQNVF